MKLIPTFVHGAMDYLVGLVLLVLPTMLNFPESARWVSWIVGVMILVQALMTQFELGIMPVLNMRAHLAADYVVGPLLALSPWILGYANDRTEVWLPFVLIGMMILGQALLTDPTSRNRTNARVA